MEFPNEQCITKAIKAELGGHIDFAKRLLQFWMAIDKDPGFARSKLPVIVLKVILSRAVKVTRQFRSVIELSERGEGADAAALARAMFETSLVIGFVLKDRFVPSEFKNGKRVPLDCFGKRLTKEFRATLYVAHHVFQPEREYERFGDRPGMIRHAKRMGKLSKSDGITQEWKDMLGPEWTQRLMRRPFTYSGLSIANLAGSLGKHFPEWYDSVYGSQSEHVHSADFLHSIEMDSETTSPKWHEGIGHIYRNLIAGIAMFYASIGMINNFIPFGSEMDSGLDAFHKSYKKLISNACPVDD